MIGHSYSINDRENGTNRNNLAAKTPVKSSHNRDIISRSNIIHNAKKEVQMVTFKLNLKANAEVFFRNLLTAVALSGSIAVATAVYGPSGTQPYVS
jgi:hypothetical protein